MAPKRRKIGNKEGVRRRGGLPFQGPGGRLLLPDHSRKVLLVEMLTVDRASRTMSHHDKDLSRTAVDSERLHDISFTYLNLYTHIFEIRRGMTFLILFLFNNISCMEIFW